MNPNARPFFVLLFFLAVIIIFAGGSIGETDLTPDTPPAPRSADSNFTAVQGVWTGGSACAGTYTIQAGDTLSGIARQCGIPLEDLITANPGLGNPNVIRPGQLIYVPNGTTTTVPDSGGGRQDAAVPVRPGGIPETGPGEWDVQVTGFPPDTEVIIGLGRLGEPPIPLAKTYRTDRNGQFKELIPIPADAREGEQWVVTITTVSEVPIVATSVPFPVDR